MQVWRPFVAVHPDHVVAFAPPGALKVGDGEVAADIVPAAFGLQYHVVVFPGGSLLVDDIGLRGVDGDLPAPSAAGIGAAKFGVEITDVAGGRLVVGLVIHVKVLPVLLGALVHQLDYGPLAEGHGRIAVEGASAIELVVLGGGGAE